MRRGGTGMRLVLAACLLVPLAAAAAGLGRLTLLSALGEPLRAEVEIVALRPGDAESLAVRLATPEAFRQAGIEYSSTLFSIRVVLDRRDGKPLVRLSSVQPVNDPFLDLLLELQWATGRLVREYTLLLDPPDFRTRAPVAETPLPAQPPVPAPTVAAPAPVEARPLAAAPAAARTYEVKKGDTLGRIARENKPEGVSFHQMLIALYRANPEAFIRKNINLVRAGRILKIPEHDAAAAIPNSEANGIVRTHHAEFAEYRAKLAAAVAAKPAGTIPGQREVTGRITAKPEAPAARAPRDQLKLSKADVAKPASPLARAAREDDKVAERRAMQEAQSRVSDLEKNVADLQKLLEIKNKQLAQLEQKAAAVPPAAPKAPEPAKPAVEPAKPAPEAPKPMAEAAKTAPETPKPVPEAAKPAPELAKPAPAPKPVPDVAKAPVAEKPKPKPAPPPPPPPEPSLIDEFLDNPLALGGLGGVIVLLAGYGAWAWRRKKAAAQSNFQDSVLGSSAGGAAPAAPVSPAQVAAAAAIPAAIAAAQQAAPSMDEVDPIAEADVYLAYGRDAQAEEILQEAIAGSPNRTALHLKLLEIYAHRRDKNGFEKTALKVKDLTQGSGPDWAKTRTLGHSVDPDNQLYGVRAGGEGAQAAAPETSGAGSAAPTLDFDLETGAAPSAGEPQTGTPAAASLDFDISAIAPEEEKKAFSPGDTVILAPGAVPKAGESPGERPPEAAKAAEGLDFDIGALEAPAAPAAAAPSPAQAPAKEESVASLDFDLDLDLGGEKPAQKTPSSPPDLSTVSLDLGKPGAATPATSSDPKWQEAATKLDLAKEYERMGDKDGARELLNEVARQGDAAQQAQAKQMLAGLA